MITNWDIIEEIKHLRFFSTDLDLDVSVLDFLRLLLRTLWIEGSNFDGKRPFGNSGWDADLAVALIKGGYVEGQIDEHGYVDSIDHQDFDALMLNIIRSLT